MPHGDVRDKSITLRRNCVSLAQTARSLSVDR
jgi:hypothetical protein